MPRIKITKIHSSHNMLSQDSYIGWAQNLPKIGDDFYMTHNDYRYEGRERSLRTTPVKSVIDMGDGRISFSTKNSEYLVEILPSDNVE